MAHDIEKQLLSLECFNMCLVLKLNKLPEQKYKPVLAVHVVCNGVEILHNFLFCLWVEAQGTREVSFHSGGDISVSCDAGWKRCNPFKTDRAWAIRIARKGAAGFLKDVLNIWDSQKAPTCLLIVGECGRKQWKLNTSKSWQLRVRALRCWGKQWQCVQDYSSHLSLLAAKDRSADKSFWKEGWDKNVSSWC